MSGSQRGLEQPPRVHRHRVARAYRDGDLVCARVEVTTRPDTRIGLAPRERRMLTARFRGNMHPALRSDLIALVRRRGAAADRVADALAAIEIVLDDDQRIVGRLQPPQRRHGPLREIEFGLRELEWTP